MKDTILKGRTKIVVTFAAIALMGSGVLLSAVPAAASQNDSPHPHVMGKHFGRHLSDSQRAEIHEHLESMSPKERREHERNARRHRGEVISGFLEISPEQLRERIKNGERIHMMAHAQGKTHEDFKAYMKDYIQEHHIFETHDAS